MNDSLVTAVVRGEMSHVIAMILMGGLLGTLLGGLVSAGAFWLLRRVGAYLLPARGVWVAVVAVASILCGLICGGIAGVQQGVLVGVRRASKGATVTATLPHIGRAGALLLASVSTLGEPGADPKDLPERLFAYELGTWTLDVSTLPERAKHLTPAVVSKAINGVQSVLAGTESEMQSPAARRVVNELLLALSAQLMAPGKTSDRGLLHYTARMLAGLSAEAARTSGGHTTITCHDLSVYLGRESLQPFVLVPLHAGVRLHQWLCLLALAAWFAGSVGVSRVIAKRQAAL